jgi:hypothetical protein
MSRTILLLGVFVGVLSGVGCRNVGGLCAARQKARPDDPSYTIEEQKRRARDKYALPPEDDFRLGPKTGSNLPGGVGR